MSLGRELESLQARYRKIFLECSCQIQEALDNGQSISQIETQYKKVYANAISKMAKSRSLCVCTGCGVCCNFAVSEFSPEVLKQKAENGDNYANQFLQTFVPYTSIDEARKIYPEYVDFLQSNTDGEFYIYHCPKVTKDNRCPDYDNRPQICRDFPDNPIAFLPPKCSFNDWKKDSEFEYLRLNAISEIIRYYSNRLENPLK